MQVWLWSGFLLLVLVFLAIDLGVANRKAHVISMREALGWTSFYVVLALAFNVFVYFLYERNWLDAGTHADEDVTGSTAAVQFFTAYILEKSLSLDNVFVIALVFAYFRIPDVYQHRVLFWGILGALVMRGAMILCGAALIARFHWIIYVFGAVLILTAVKMLVAQDENLEPEKNPLVRLARRFLPVDTRPAGSKFFIKDQFGWSITPLFLALLMVESTDLLFAIDSIPAVFGVTQDPFLVFTSNIFAVLGLRSLYFVLAGMINRFRYLKTSLAFVLAYVGVKMLLSHHYPIPNKVSLAIVAGILLVGVLASLRRSKDASTE